MSFIKEFWLPDAEILNLKEFKTLDVLSKLEVEYHFLYSIVQRKHFVGIMAEQKLWDNVCSGNKNNLHLSNDIQQFPTGCASLSVSGMQNLMLF